MKKIIMFTAVMTMAGIVNAEPVFRLMDLAHPQTSAGVFSARDGHFATGGVLAVVLHPPRTSEAIAVLDGWVPLDIGGSIGGGFDGPSLALGTGVNLLPSSKAVILTLLDALTKDDQFTNIKDALNPPRTGSVDLVPFIGPHYNLVFITLTHAYLLQTWFIGGTLKF